MDQRGTHVLGDPPSAGNHITEKGVGHFDNQCERDPLRRELLVNIYGELLYLDIRIGLK